MDHLNREMESIKKSNECIKTEKNVKLRTQCTGLTADWVQQNIGLVNLKTDQ